MTDRPAHRFTEDLMLFLEFTEHDLKENQRGLLSRAQRARLWGHRRYVALILGFLGVLIAGIYLWSRIQYENLGIQLMFQGFLFLWIVFLMVIAASIFWSQYDAVRAILRGQVETTTGPVRLWREPVGSRRPAFICYAAIADKSFIVSKEVYPMLIEGETYTFYFLPHLNFLLSLEITELPPEKQKNV